jgi:hypothetical protein
MRVLMTISFVAAATAVAFADGTGKVLVPRATVIPVLVPQELRGSGVSATSGTNHLHLQVAQDVIVGHQLVAKAGDLVDADLSNTTNVSVGIMTHAGTVETVTVDDIVNFCGDTIHASGQFSATGSVKSGIFGPKVKDAVIPKGAILLASTDRAERKVCSQKTAALPAPVPANAVTPSAQ